MTGFITLPVRGRFTSPSGSQPEARVSYLLTWYDPINREAVRADYGTNSGTTLSTPTAIPSPSNTVLVTTTAYDNAGDPNSVTDPRGITNTKTFDNGGRVLETVEDYDGNTWSTTTFPDHDRTTDYTYNPDGQISTITAHNPLTSGDQVTLYIYGTGNDSNSSIASFSLLRGIIYPTSGDTVSYDSSGDPTFTIGTGGYNHVELSYDSLGEVIQKKDQNGTVHQYDIDGLGRQVNDRVTTVASGVDGAVLRVSQTYEVRGMLNGITCYDNAVVGSGSVTSDIERTYNSYGQLVTEQQQHGEAVTSSSPQVSYAYDDASSGSNEIRINQMTYPNGRVLNYGYDNSTLDNTLNRVDYLADDGGSSAGNHLEDYLYLGLGTIVERDHAETGTNLTYIQQSGDTYANADGGDQYTGLDRFGRVIDQFWLPIPTSNNSGAVRRFQYAYDDGGNALYKNRLTKFRGNLVSSVLSELYHRNSSAGADNATAYDNLNRIVNFVQGALSASGNNGTSGLGSLDTVSTVNNSYANYDENWNLDTLGNWSQFTDDGASASRTHNALNELTQIGSSTNLTYDNNGNTLADDQGYGYTYDAWNRQKTASQSSASPIVVIYAYDGLGRRISTDVSPKSTGPGSVPVVLQINDGTVQASDVDSLTLTFQSAVSLTSSNLTLDQTNGGTTPVSFTLSSPGSASSSTIWTLTFASNGTTSGYSLPNGAYSLNVSIGSINQTFTFYRFYGDFNADGVVNGTDFAMFNEQFGQGVNSTNWYFSHDPGVGTAINGSDFSALSVDFGLGRPAPSRAPLSGIRPSRRICTILPTGRSWRKTTTPSRAARR